MGCWWAVRFHRGTCVCVNPRCTDTGGRPGDIRVRMELHGAAFPHVPLPRDRYSCDLPVPAHTEREARPWSPGAGWEGALNSSCWAGTSGHPAPLGPTPVPAPGARAWRRLLENPELPVAALTPHRSPTGSRSAGDRAEPGTDRRSWLWPLPEGLEPREPAGLRPRGFFLLSVRKTTKKRHFAPVTPLFHPKSHVGSWKQLQPHKRGCFSPAGFSAHRGWFDPRQGRFPARGRWSLPAPTGAHAPRLFFSPAGAAQEAREPPPRRQRWLPAYPQALHNRAAVT